MATEIWVNIGSGNGLLPDGTKPLQESMLTDHQWSPVTFILGWFHKRCLNHQSLKSVWKITYLEFVSNFPGANELTHWGRVMHISVSKLTISGSNNGLSPDRRQAIIWTNAGFLLIGPLGTNFSEILIKILTFSFKKMRLKVSSAKRRPFCLGLNVLMSPSLSQITCWLDSRAFRPKWLSEWFSLTAFF